MTTPSTFAQGPVAPITPERLAEVRERFAAIPHSEPDSLTGHVKGMLALIDNLTASPSPAASPSGAITHAIASLAAAISLLERAPKAKKAAPSDRMFEQMLCDYRKALDEARASLASDATPAPTSGSEDGGEAAFPADGELASMERSDSFNAFDKWARSSGLPLHMAESGLGRFYADDRTEWAWQSWCCLAKPASEPAGGDVGEALRWVEQNLAAAKRAMKTSAEHSDGRSNFAAHDAHKNLSTIAAALSSSAGPAVAWRYRYQRSGQPAPWMVTTLVEDTMGIDVESQPLYAHPAPATVEMREEKCRAVLEWFQDETEWWETPREFRDKAKAALAPATEGRKG